MPSRTRRHSRKHSRKHSRRRSYSRKRKHSRKSSRKSSKNARGSRARFLRIGKSPIKGKKYRAYFSNGTHTDFGAVGYSDFTKHRDPARRQRYLNRHRKRENWSRGSGCKSAGSLSRFILWGQGGLRENVAAYKRRCG